MSTYYEMLGIPSSASTTEIEAALAVQYDRWRKLVTHHDPIVVEKANQSMRALESIRTTLTDPAKRAGYDAGVGIGGVIDGLADPEAVFRQAATTPSSLPVAPRSSTTAAGLDLWTCPNPDCGANNPAQTRFCFKCRTELVRQCPECGKMSSLAATGNCGECGYPYDLALQRHAVKERCDALQKTVQELTAEIGKESHGTSWGYVIGGTAVAAVCAALVSFFLAIPAIGNGYWATFWAFTVVITLATGLFLYLNRRTRLGGIAEISKTLEPRSEELKAATSEWETLALGKIH